MDLDFLLSRALALGASDVHLKLGQRPMVRRDGVILPAEELAPLTEEDLESTLERVCEYAPARRLRFHETGELDTAYSGHGLPRFRLNAFRQRGAISFAFRVIPTKVPPFEKLGLPAGVRRLADAHSGLLLVTGATGSGKTTTLAAIVDHINHTRRQHIITIEDPIEFLHEDEGCIVSQREIGLDTDSFAEALRRAVRQDPDVLCIGELRDSESAATAIHAAESGHLVVSTLHTLDAKETITRLIEFFPPEKHGQTRAVLASTLRGVVSQRLLPRIGGGRVPAVEVMVVTARIADLIRHGAIDEIPAAIAEGEYFDMQSADRALIDLVVSGAVGRDEAATIAPNGHDFALGLDHALKEQAVNGRHGRLAELRFD